jgi:hypothetical protein
MKSLITPGRYRHYKGPEYQVVGTARHSETEEDLVLYYPLSGDANETLYWVRPLDMFIEQVDVEGQLLPRFSLVAPDA